MAADRLYVPKIQVQWQPPEKGTIKLNFDGGLCRRRGCAVSAGIFRDHNGVPVYSYAFVNPIVTGYTSYEGEAKALALGLHVGIQLAQDLRDQGRGQEITKLWVEGDAKLLIDVTRSGRPNFWYDEGTISYIRYLMTLFAEERLMLTFIEREGNEAADALVRHARDDVFCQEREWGQDQELPKNVADIVNQERNGYTYERKDRYVPRPKSCYVPPS